MAHTPGPWIAGPRPLYGTGLPVMADNGRQVASVTQVRGDHAVLANARLIAAAPDLLAALKAIVKSLADYDDEGMIEHAEPIIAARSAIAKAEL